MRKLICAVCGRPVLAESLCEEHYVRKHELFEAKPLLIGLATAVDRFSTRNGNALNLKMKFGI